MYIYIPSNFEIIQIIVYFTCLMSFIFNKCPILFLWRSCSFFNNEGRQTDINNIKTWFLLVVNLLDNFQDIFWWAKHLKTDCLRRINSEVDLVSGVHSYLEFTDSYHFNLKDNRQNRRPTLQDVHLVIIYPAKIMEMKYQMSACQNISEIYISSSVKDQQNVVTMCSV